jgi:hypothetical protein
MADKEIDRVAMPSLKADGTPDQTPGFEVLDEEAAKKQAEQRSAVTAGNEAAVETTEEEQPKRRSKG